MGLRCVWVLVDWENPKAGDFSFLFFQILKEKDGEKKKELESSALERGEKILRYMERRKNKSSKNCTWSAVPDALLGVIAEEVEWEQGSGPKGPMSCRSRVNFHASWEGIFEAFGAIFPNIQLEFCIFLKFLINFPCYSMEISYFFHFSSISNVIQWEVCILSISHVIQ